MRLWYLYILNLWSIGCEKLTSQGPELEYHTIGNRQASTVECMGIGGGGGGGAASGAAACSGAISVALFSGIKLVTWYR